VQLDGPTCTAQKPEDKKWMRIDEDNSLCWSTSASRANKRDGMQAMEFFTRTLTGAAEAIDKGLDPNKAAGGDQSKEAKDMATNVSSFLGWAISSISLAATSSGATPQKERVSGGSTPSKPPANGASARRDLAASGAWENGAENGAAASQAPPLTAELSASGRLAGEVDTSSLDKLAGAPSAFQNAGLRLQKCAAVLWARRRASCHVLAM